MILCCDPGPGASLGPVVHRGSRPSGIDCVGGWRRSLLRTLRGNLWRGSPCGPQRRPCHEHPIEISRFKRPYAVGRW